MIHRFFKKPLFLTVFFFALITCVFYSSKSSHQIAAYNSATIGKITTNIDKLSTSKSSQPASTKEGATKPDTQKQQQQQQLLQQQSVSSTEKQTVENSNDQESLGSSIGQIALEPFMPKMENATLKQELGRATWKLLHNILARYPDDPTDSEKQSLKQFFDLFVRIYPCGDCATHFRKLLDKYPPQVQNKQTAALWGCHLHNKVNERLQKPIYDCTGILNDYDCGCGGKDKDDADSFKQLSDQKTGTGQSKAGDSESLDHLKSIKIESSEGLQRGG